MSESRGVRMSGEQAAWGTGLSIEALRSELQSGHTPDLRRRRGIIGLSLVGMASMAVVTLRRTLAGESLRAIAPPTGA